GKGRVRSGLRGTPAQVARYLKIFRRRACGEAALRISGAMAKCFGHNFACRSYGLLTMAASTAQGGSAHAITKAGTSA
ncbi:MAG: hypothetical protein AB1745_20165, partial [Pseudomonadota bacterium]